MEPVEFEQQNKILHKPKNMTDEQCRSLPVYSGEGICVSKWKMNFKERIHCLFRGYIWVMVVFAGGTQPPIALDAEKTIFRE